jgi:hypothetical protein
MWKLYKKVLLSYLVLSFFEVSSKIESNQIQSKFNNEKNFTQKLNFVSTVNLII